MASAGLLPHTEAAVHLDTGSVGREFVSADRSSRVCDTSSGDSDPTVFPAVLTVL